MTYQQSKLAMAYAHVARARTTWAHLLKRECLTSINYL